MAAVVALLKNGANVNRKDTQASLSTSLRYTSQFKSIKDHRKQIRVTLLTILPTSYSIILEISNKIEILNHLFTILLFSLQHYIKNFSQK